MSTRAHHELRHRTLYMHSLPNHCCDVLVSQLAIEFDQRSNPTTEFPPGNLSYDSQNPNGRGLSCQAARLAPPPKADRHQPPKHVAPHARDKTPKSASAVLRLSTTHGPKVRPIVPLGPALSKHKSRVDWYGRHAVALPTSHIFSVSTV